jgi:hypothetical protein
MKRLLPWLGSSVVIAGIYVGSYYGMVESVRVPLWVGAEGTVPSYAFGGKFSEALFLPMNKLDSICRPDVWNIRDVDEGPSRPLAAQK